MRTYAQRRKRGIAYRILSVVWILIGATHLFMALTQGDVHDEAYLRKIEIAFLWLMFGGTFVALSRIWGELAEEKAASTASK